jgi:hypothetical protein
MFEPRNPLRYYPCRISCHKCSFYVQPWGRIKGDIPAFKRGWIFQERLLSRRNIYFGMEPQMGEITWECFEGHGTETDLTYPSDKLVAIAGIATTISLKASSNYIAGMWMFTLPAGLLWLTRTNPSRDPPPERPAWRGAPSWSWASLDTKIDGNWPELLDRTTSQGLESFQAMLVDCETQPVTGRPATFGEYESAKLRIVSVLRPIREINRDEDEPETDGSREFGSNLINRVLSLADVIISAGTTLFYFTVFRGWAAEFYDSSKWYKEEGLVLMPHLDGYVRVGRMRIRFHKEEKGNVLNDLLWGGGKLEMITIY